MEVDKKESILALGVCVLVRNLWGYYRVIAGVGGVDGDADMGSDGLIPYALIYDFGDEIAGLSRVISEIDFNALS